MALHADIGSAHRIEPRRINNVVFCGMFHVGASRAVTFFASHIPLGDLLGLDIVVDGVATIAKRTCGSFKIAVWIMGSPPVCSFLNMVGKPFLLLDVPLRREHIVIVAAACEVALFPTAAIDESNIFQLKGANRVWMGKVAEDCFRVLCWVADHIGHAGM